MHSYKPLTPSQAPFPPFLSAVFAMPLVEEPAFEAEALTDVWFYHFHRIL